MFDNMRHTRADRYDVETRMKLLEDDVTELDQGMHELIESMTKRWDRMTNALIAIAVAIVVAIATAAVNIIIAGGAG